MTRFLVVVSILLSSFVGRSAVNYAPKDTVVYKVTEQGELTLHVFYPPGYNKGDNRPAVVSFFGGGWAGGHPRQFYQQSSFFASKGLVAFSAEYRIRNTHKTTPFECVEDGKSAIRFVRAHAKEFGVNPNQIVASGGSAGGHVAACTAIIEGFESEENSQVSSMPNAMILFNPVLDTTPKGYGASKVKGRETEISPCHRVKPNLPPSLIFHGTNDTTVPFENALRFEQLMKSEGNDCTLVPVFGKGHGFFNSSWFRKTNKDDDFFYTLYQSEVFLWKNGFLQAEPAGWNLNVTHDEFGKAPLESSEYHQIRSGLKNSQVRFVKDKKGTVAFLGGSITYNKGWRNMVSEDLEKRFPDTEFTFIYAGAPSEGTTSASFRLLRDVLSKGEVDLLFEEAAVNDRSPALRRNSEDRVRGMEGIVRHALAVNPSMDLVMMHFVDPSKMEAYREGKDPQEILDHEKVAEHYGVASINLAKEVTDRIDAGEFTWEDDFKNLHPSPFGQKVYYNSMKVLLDKCYYGFVADDDKISAKTLPAKLDPFCYDSGHLVGIDAIKVSKGWSIDPSWSPKKGERIRKGYSNCPYLVSNEIGKKLTFSFTGSSVGFVGLSGPDAGIIEYSIDGGAFKTFDQFTSNSHYQHLARYFVLESELDPTKKHKLVLRTSQNTNAKSKGNACRISSFLVN